MKNKDIK